MRTLSARFLVTLALALSGCDSSDGTEGGTSGPTEGDHDAADSSSDVYEDSADQRAASGDGSANDDVTEDDAGAVPLILTARLESEPGVVGRNALLIRLVDEGGPGLPGAEITVDPQMPSMGHGSHEVAVVEDLGDGDYRAYPVTFTMPGEWEVTVEASIGDRRAELVLEFEP